MWKTGTVIAMLVAASGMTFGDFKSTPQERAVVATRFGSLTVDGENTLLFNGRRVSPEVVGNNYLDFGEAMQIADTDVVLVRNNGGTACPSLYYFVTITKTGAKATKAFGTCADAISTKQHGNSIRVVMSGFLGPFQPEAAQLRAARQRHTFVYRAGMVTKKGRPVK